MSYFIAGSCTDKLLRDSLERSFVDVVPHEIKNDVLHIDGPASFLASYGNTKVINNVVVRHSPSCSWLAVLGTPLIKLPAENECRAFLDRFVEDPKRFINDEIDGCFAVMAYDGVTDTLFAATDYNNTTPVYYALTKQGVHVSSHELPLARLLQAEIDPLGFTLAIHMRNTWGGYTRFKNIHRLQPCQVMSFHGVAEPRSEIYWSPSTEPQWQLSFDDAVERWLSVLKQSVQRYHDSATNKTVICDFTAGEDSRLLVSTCHALGIPFRAQVTGLDSEIDVIVTREAARRTGIDLVVRRKHAVMEDQLLNHAIYISLMQDACEEFSRSCIDYATDAANPTLNYDYVKYCGCPGGEAYRGSYYLRGKAFFPSRKGRFDHRFFTTMKYLLDFHSGLLRFPDSECKGVVFALVEDSLKDVNELPVGTRIDHLLRVFQTCCTGLVYKNPRYLPLASKDMTRSIYGVPPHFKRGGRLTRACTEILFPELAVVRTQNGVPTIRKTLARTPLFLPEYMALARFLYSGTMSRLLKWTDSNKTYFKWSENASAIMTILNKPPYADWFASPGTMRTGHLYNGDALNALLSGAKGGASRYVPVLGRIVNQELACRWVYQDAKSSQSGP